MMSDFFDIEDHVRLNTRTMTVRSDDYNKLLKESKALGLDIHDVINKYMGMAIKDLKEVRVRQQKEQAELIKEMKK